MDKIKLSDIDLSTMKIIGKKGTTSTLYEDGDLCIKILDKLFEEEKEIIYRKFLEMDGLYIDNVLFPISLIIDNDKLVGYTMENFKDSKTLLEYLGTTRYINCKEIFDKVKKISLILRQIHNNGIIYQDLSFENILIDKSGNIKYCDLDSCTYKNNRSEFISRLLNSFLIDYRKQKQIYVSENLDRISMMLAFFQIVYVKELQKISRRKYHSLSDNIKTLDNAKEFANILLDRNNPISDIPYIDELIDNNDDYIIDRKKQLSLIKRIMY